jgi:hypothetical protein
VFQRAVNEMIVTFGPTYDLEPLTQLDSTRLSLCRRVRINGCDILFARLARPVLILEPPQVRPVPFLAGCFDALWRTEPRRALL